jgi:hypothetical protein
MNEDIFKGQWKQFRGKAKEMMIWIGLIADWFK